MLMNDDCLQVLVLSPTTQTYQRWVAPDQPLFFEVFMFNWTNADQFPREKPQLEQLGEQQFQSLFTTNLMSHIGFLDILSEYAGVFIGHC